MKFQRYKEVLLKLRTRIEGDFEGLRKGIVEVGLIMGQTEHEILQDIEDALERIEAGTYGTCDDCGQPIPERRLRAIPYTVVCIACEEERERSAP